MTNTDICNMALGKIGASQIKNLADTTENIPSAIQCRLHFEQTRDSLIRSHYWRFASARAELTQDTTDPAFEWDSQFILPDDFMRLKSVWGDNFTPTGNTELSFAIEGQRILTNEASVDIRYIKKVEDPDEFDSLFVEVLVLHLALKLVAPLSGANPKLQQVLVTELRLVMPRVRALDRQETNTIGRINRRPWVEARISGGGTGLRPAVP